MKIVMVISLVALIKEAMAECDRNSVIVRGRCHKKEVLVDNLSRIQNLVVDFHTNVLYFSNRSNFEVNYSSCYLDLNTKELGVITQVVDGRAQAVDQIRHEVYVAGREGIYKFHYNNKTVERLGGNDIGTKLMFYKDDLYCSSSEERLHIYKNGQFTVLQDMKNDNSDLFVIDSGGYLLFRNITRILGKIIGTKDLDLYQHRVFASSMTTDVTGNPFSCYRKRIYFINKVRKTFEPIGVMLDYCDNITFDKDNNIIYSYDDKIIKINMNDQD